MSKFMLTPRELSSALLAKALSLCTDAQRGVELAEIQANLARIEAVPFDVMPDASRERNVLIALAWLGHDVDAYTPMGCTEWTIWCRPERADMDGRYSVEAWRAICLEEWLRLVNKKDGDA